MVQTDAANRSTFNYVLCPPRQHLGTQWWVQTPFKCTNWRSSKQWFLLLCMHSSGIILIKVFCSSICDECSGHKIMQLLKVILTTNKQSDSEGNDTSACWRKVRKMRERGKCPKPVINVARIFSISYITIRGFPMLQANRKYRYGQLLVIINEELNTELHECCLRILWFMTTIFFSN